MIERSIRIELIDSNPYQTRRIFNDKKIEELAASIKAVGLLNRILLRPHPDIPGRFQLVHGERRLRACKRLGWETIPAIIRKLNDAEMAEINLVENLQREDLNPIEEAEGYQALMKKFNYSIKAVAEKIGKSRPYISNSIRLLKMPFFIKACVWCQTITVSHAIALMGLPEGYQHYLLGDLVMDWGLSVAETRRIVTDVKAGGKWVSWVRNVPISGLVELDSFKESLQGKSKSEKRSILHSMERGWLEPIFVLVNGVVVDGYEKVDAARMLGWNTIRAEVLFRVDWLQEVDSEIVRTSQQLEAGPLQRGIIPEMTDEQRRNIRKLLQLLRCGEAPS